MPGDAVQRKGDLRDRRAVQIKEIVAQHVRALRGGGDGVILGVHQGKGGDQRRAAVPGDTVPLDTGGCVVPAHGAVIVDQQRQAVHLIGVCREGTVRGRQGLAGICRAVVVVIAVQQHGTGHTGDGALAVLTPLVAGGQRRALRQGQRGREQLGIRHRRHGDGKALVHGAEVGVRAGGIVTVTGGPGLPQGQGQGRGAEARGQRTPTARRAAAGQGTLGLLQQIVVDGVHPALHSVVVHSIPSFSSTVRRR